MKRPLDLGIKAPPHNGQPVPNFSNRESTNGTLTAVSGVQDIFNPRGACTVQWVFVQAQTPCTIQLLSNGQPIGAPIALGATFAARFPGLLLPNNTKLSLSISSTATVAFEIAWVKSFSPELMATELVLCGGSSASTKKTVIETSALLGANAIFTGAWHDSQLDGTFYVVATCSPPAQAGAAVGFAIDISDDITNAALTVTVASMSILTSFVNRIRAKIDGRYWRVRYVNGAVAQTGTFEITSTAMNFPPTPTVFTGSAGTAGGGTDAGAPVFPICQNTSGTGDGTNGTFSGLPAAIGGFGFPVCNLNMVARNGASVGAWDNMRTCTTFKQASTAATGSTALWTPTAGKKFRLMRFRVQVTALAKAAAAADLKIALLDSAADLGVSSYCTIPVAAAGNGVISDTGWIDLGNGVMSSLANNVLNINLSFALTGGLVNVTCAGTEE